MSSSCIYSNLDLRLIIKTLKEERSQANNQNQFFLEKIKCIHQQEQTTYTRKEIEKITGLSQMEIRGLLSRKYQADKEFILNKHRRLYFFDVSYFYLFRLIKDSYNNRKAYKLIPDKEDYKEKFDNPEARILVLTKNVENLDSFRSFTERICDFCNQNEVVCQRLNTQIIQNNLPDTDKDIAKNQAQDQKSNLEILLVNTEIMFRIIIQKIDKLDKPDKFDETIAT